MSQRSRFKEARLSQTASGTLERIAPPPRVANKRSHTISTPAYEDRITIPTPEGVELELPLAGLGSRFVAALVDAVIKGAVIVAALVGVGALGATSNFGADLSAENPPGDLALAALALFLAFTFLVNFGYDVLFETLASGRTPGKRWTGLRVVKLDGGPVTFTTSAVRNLVRLVDGLFAYAVGVVAILASARNQRLGDLAAGTVVVRERRAPAAGWARHGPAATPDDLETWDVSAVTSEDIVTVRRFLDRRPELTPEARGRLAQEFALRLRPKVAGAPEGLHPEVFLEHLAAAKGART